MLRCVSRWELLQQISSGGPSDALLFSQQPQESPVHSAMSKFRDRLLMRGPSTPRAASQQLNKAGKYSTSQLTCTMATSCRQRV